MTGIYSDWSTREIIIITITYLLLTYQLHRRWFTCTAPALRTGVRVLCLEPISMLLRGRLM